MYICGSKHYYIFPIESVRFVLLLLLILFIFFICFVCFAISIYMFIFVGCVYGQQTVVLNYLLHVRTFIPIFIYFCLSFLFLLFDFRFSIASYSQLIVNIKICGIYCIYVPTSNPISLDKKANENVLNVKICVLGNSQLLAFCSIFFPQQSAFFKELNFHCLPIHYCFLSILK